MAVDYRSRPIRNGMGYLQETSADIPTGVSAIIANKAGIGVIWNERDDASDLQKVAHNLKKMQQTAKKFADEA